MAPNGDVLAAMILDETPRFRSPTGDGFSLGRLGTDGTSSGNSSPRAQTFLLHDCCKGRGPQHNATAAPHRASCGGGLRSSTNGEAAKTFDAVDRAVRSAHSVLHSGLQSELTERRDPLVVHSLSTQNTNAMRQVFGARDDSENIRPPNSASNKPPNCTRAKPPKSPRCAPAATLVRSEARVALLDDLENHDPSVSLQVQVPSFQPHASAPPLATVTCQPQEKPAWGPVRGSRPETADTRRLSPRGLGGGQRPPRTTPPCAGVLASRWSISIDCNEASETVQPPRRRGVSPRGASIDCNEVSETVQPLRRRAASPRGAGGTEAETMQAVRGRAASPSSGVYPGALRRHLSPVPPVSSKVGPMVEAAPHSAGGQPGRVVSPLNVLFGGDVTSVGDKAEEAPRRQRTCRVGGGSAEVPARNRWGEATSAEAPPRNRWNRCADFGAVGESSEPARRRCVTEASIGSGSEVQVVVASKGRPATSRNGNEDKDAKGGDRGRSCPPQALTPRSANFLEKRTSALSDARKRQKERLSAEARAKRFATTIRGRLDEVLNGLKTC